MAYTISEIRDEIARIIEATTPDISSAITWREAPYSAPLEELEVAARPSDTTRTFHALPSPHQEVRAWSPYPEILGPIRVQIRYVADRTQTALRTIHTLASSDAARIHRALCEPAAGHWGAATLTHAIGLELLGTTLEPAPDREGLWILTMDLESRYILGD